jgi:hypothetical protein
VLQNQGIYTDREVTAKRPGVIIKNKEKTCILIDMILPADRYVMQKEEENNLK